ncbi:hypothetical protein [Campylobacter concisus]|nr:hypothetical protein [Campylobacter concisus]ERJ29751.1 Phosphomethylpyrimidine kinase [Campylobacter concisus ATCC 51561]
MALVCYPVKDKRYRVFKEYICSIIKESIDTKLGKNCLLWHGAK